MLFKLYLNELIDKKIKVTLAQNDLTCSPSTIFYWEQFSEKIGRFEQLDVLIGQLNTFGWVNCK